MLYQGTVHRSSSCGMLSTDHLQAALIFRSFRLRRYSYQALSRSYKSWRVLNEKVGVSIGIVFHERDKDPYTGSLAVLWYTLCCQVQPDKCRLLTASGMCLESAIWLFVEGLRRRSWAMSRKCSDVVESQFARPQSVYGPAMVYTQPVICPSSNGIEGVLA